jgi:hypothetical protein
MTESDLQEKEIKQNFGYAFLLTSILRLHKHYMFSKMKLDRRENLGYKIKKNPPFSPLSSACIYIRWRNKIPG